MAPERQLVDHLQYAIPNWTSLTARSNSPAAASPAAQTVGRLPQTTQGMPQGGPFIRYAEESQQQGYSAAAQAFGALITLPLSAVSGFLRALIVKVQATGGSGATVVTAAADAPFNVISQLTFKDSSGQTIYPAVDGYSLYLINLYSCQTLVGQGGLQDPKTLPSWSVIQTASGTGAGNFIFKLWVPLEFNSSGYCSLPSDNSAEVPKLVVQLAGSATVYAAGGVPATLPTLTVTVEEPYWAVPNNMPDLAPFDVGASAQWILTTSGQNPPSNAYMRVLDQGVGQFVHTKIVIYRDSLNVRQDFFPTNMELWVDNFQYRNDLIDDRYDRLYKHFGVTRPTGVVAYTWRNSIQEEVSTADDAENILVTTGSTKVEYGGTWQTNANAPAQLTTLTGMIFPGQSGWPYGSQGG
jgi:hypothetical protein